MKYILFFLLYLSIYSHSHATTITLSFFGEITYLNGNSESTRPNVNVGDVFEFEVTAVTSGIRSVEYQLFDVLLLTAPFWAEDYSDFINTTAHGAVIYNDTSIITDVHFGDSFFVSGEGSIFDWDIGSTGVFQQFIYIDDLWEFEGTTVVTQRISSIPLQTSLLLFFSSLMLLPFFRYCYRT